VPESEDERLDRELIELLNELRVVLPGVQVLFAFLLTIPFASGFTRLGPLDRDIYFVALLAAVLATLLLIAPTAFHRVLFRHHDKDWLLKTATLLILGGLVAVGVAMTCSVFVIADFVFGGVAAAIATTLTGTCTLLLWFVLPIARRALVRSRDGRTSQRET
jgi:hypothetical protein